MHLSTDGVSAFYPVFYTILFVVDSAYYFLHYFCLHLFATEEHWHYLVT